MSTAVYELLLRHPNLITPNTLILGAESDLPAGWLALLSSSGAQFLTWDWLSAQAHRPLTEPQVRFAIPQSEDFRGKQVILLWPKAKQQAQALIQLMATQVSECWIVGANDAGGKSIGKACAALSNRAEKTDSARHCTLWQLQLKAVTEFNWLKLAQSFTCQQQAFMTLPGVFSHGKLDTGTALLLEHVPAPAHGKLLDLGCGSGVIGLSMKAAEPALDITLADIDAFAIRSSQLNSTRLNLPATILASDGLSRIEGRFDYLFSNPPFHLGKGTDYEFARRLFSEARQHLTRDGQMWIVANRHLPYEDWAAEQFRQVEIMVQDKGFKLLCVQNG
ncbi:MAG: class I SAM-dependent methyltransferase [Saccharospirillaceae bacterium]|nr:class I SAM-dependent methyltransferase [Saccharospirillaceae bacterium]